MKKEKKEKYANKYKVNIQRKNIYIQEKKQI